jgi:hypothetical protein
VNVTSPITNSGTSTSAQLGFDQTAQNTTNDGRYARLGSANAFTVGGHTITAESAAIIPLQINGAASQSANLLEVRNSTPAIVARIGTDGAIRSSVGFGSTASGLSFINMNIDTNAVGISPGTATNKGLVIRGAASQTADLLQLQNSTPTVLGGRNAVAQIYSGSTSTITSAVGGTIQSIATGSNPLVTMASAHGLAVGDLVTLAGTTGSTYNGTFSIATVPASTTFTITTALTTGQAAAGGTAAVPAQASITARSAGTKGLVIRSAGTSNIQEWLNSGGTTSAFINSSGSFRIGTNITGTILSLNLDYVANNPTGLGLVVRGQTSQIGDLQQNQNYAGTVTGGRNANAQIFTGSTTTINSGVGGATTAASGDGTVATLTMTSATNLTIGDLIVVAGVTPTGYNTTGAVVSAVSNTSPFTVSYLNATSGAQTVAGTVSTPAQASVTARSSGTVGQIIRGTASQSADLQQWQNSGATVLAKIIAGGNMFATDFRTTNTYGLLGEANSGGRLFMTRGTTAVTNPGTNSATLYFRDGTTAGTLKLVVRAGTAGAETTILDNIPQT